MMQEEAKIVKLRVVIDLVGLKYESMEGFQEPLLA